MDATAEKLSEIAAGRNRHGDGRFAPESLADMPNVGELSLSSTDSSSSEPLQLAGTLARRKKDPTAYQAQITDDIKAVCEGGWDAVLELRPRRGYHKYSINNTYGIVAHYRRQGIDSPVVASASAWREKGRIVRDDAEGCAVTVPRKWERDEEVVDSNGESTIETRSGVFFTQHPKARVFDLSETDPDPEAEDPDAWRSTTLGTTNTGTNTTAAVHAALVDVVDSLGVSLREESPQTVPMGAQGYLDRKNKVIAVDKTLPPEDQVAVLAHELGHWFDPTLRRDPGLYKDHRGDAETVAELTAMSVGKELGLETGGSAGYLRSWNPEWKPTTVKFANNVVKRWIEAHTQIMDAIERVANGNSGDAMVAA